MSPEFKVPEGDGDESKTSTVTISLFDRKKFNQIKGNLSFYRGRTVTSQETISELIQTWIESKREQVLMKGDSN